MKIVKALVGLALMVVTLRQTRDAVNSLAGRPEPLASCPNRSSNFANPKLVRAEGSFGLR